MRMKQRIRIIGVIGYLLVAGHSMAGIVQGTVMIHGKLTAGVQLQVEYGDKKIQKTVSDNNGKFHLNVPQAGSWKLTIFRGKKPYDTMIQVQSTTVSYTLDLARSRSGKDRLVKR